MQDIRAPKIRLCTLGALDLRNADGAVVGSVLAQPKRTAVLAYLALARPHGFHRRDTLLALFWPEFDEKNARNALNKAVHFLRRSVGAEGVISRGNDELGLDPEHCWCDCIAFEQALDAEEVEAALELYSGELLPGFHLSGAPEFEQWLAVERARLGERARNAAGALAERAEAAGDGDGAVRWARRTLAVAPNDERALRRLISLLDRLGDLAGALREYDDFAARLARTYEMEPAAETRALVEGLQGRMQRETTSPSANTEPTGPNAQGADAASERVASAAERAVREAHRPERDPQWPEPGRRSSVRHPVRSPARRGRPRLRRTLPIIGVLALGLAWFALHPAAHPEPASAGNTPAAVAVFPFSFHGVPGFAYLGEGMADLLSTSLDGAGRVRAVDPRALLSLVARERSAPIGPERGRAIAEHFGASYFVLGGIVEIGGQFQLTASLYRGGEPGQPVTRAAVAGDAAAITELVDDLARLLLASLPGDANERIAQLAALTTTSLPALKAYLEGEQAFRAGRYAEALGAFRRAVERDTTFALAYYRLSNTLTWTEAGPPPDPVARRALRYAGRLSARDRHLLDAWRAYVHAEASTAERLYRAALARHPEDIEARYYLGEVLYHWGPTLGTPAAASAGAFRRVLDYEPHNASALIHLARLAAAAGGQAEFDTLAARLATLEPEGGRTLELRALRAFAFGDSAAQRRIRDRLRYVDGNVLRRILTTIAVFSDDLAGAARLASDFVAATPMRDEHAVGQLLGVQFEMARGRPAAAFARLHSSDALPAPRRAEYEAALSALDLVPRPPAVIARLRDEVRNAPAPIGPIGPTDEFLTSDGIYAPRRLYLLGLLARRARDSTAAARRIADIESFRGGTPMDTAFAADYARLLRAVAARLRGEPRVALAALGEPRVEPDRTLPEILSYPEAHERWLRAELLRELGRDEEALAWYATFPDPQGYDLMYLAQSHLKRAEIYERIGETIEAAEHYQRFIELWRDAEPRLRPEVGAARRALARPGGG